MNYKSDNDDNGKKSLERQFAEHIRVIEYAKLYDEFVALLANSERKKTVGDQGALIHLLEGAALPVLFKGDAYKFIQTIFGKAAPEVSAILSDEIKRFRADRFLDWVLTCDKRLKESGREPLLIDIDDILIPLIQGMSTKKNMLIQEMYENLLTAAIIGEKVDVKDINNLKLLETNDVLILEAMYKMGYDSCRGDAIKYQSGVSIEHFKSAIDGLISQGIVESTVIGQIDMAIETALSNITRDKGAAEYTASQKEMFYLDLEAISMALKQALTFTIEAQTTNKYDLIRFTNKGWEFMQKCKGIITKSVETEQNP
jgi:hypothetical protein